MDDELPEAIKKCIKILEENIDILSNIELDLEDQKEDEMVSNLKIHDLYDMTEDLAESAKLKRAEFNLMRRNAEDVHPN
ncbi:MAG: hypothetical protein COW26_01585 [Nitrosopumilales archaeon CG15_BIG_FIL_POST_REV_8_21_14_020_33_23]|nr:MAG: hypothetical protein COV65_05980 [Nitrosopumilales archaeon CG11_big_fil_rev_8_21_14_0_20_33_24]PIW35971.1 MAG: hypothetical protein COW26_01585 [Nitrosopumilales archaeon CG15_BIG_FIL_POST_REV_8_21_14_020_33_23]PIY90340.1 MAG: hypothetical protein COY74_01990 [Nitrosopumilales archaeon CG_4_10_14_0_8_um_filter_34_8]PJB96711.1 MAG: hypothetical protein CO079_09275 [Nitrosopumilales archaeon CG_4_9_14_0_8_um_filter_34_10]